MNETIEYIQVHRILDEMEVTPVYAEDVKGWRCAIAHMRGKLLLSFAHSSDANRQSTPNEYGHAAASDFGTSSPEDCAAAAGPGPLPREHDRRREAPAERAPCACGGDMPYPFHSPKQCGMTRRVPLGGDA